jgi:MFS family permease
MKPLEADFGWDRASISAAVAISLLTYGLGAPFGGRLMDRFGPRKVLIGATLLTLVGSAGTLRMGTLLELTLWWGVVVGVGSGMLAMVLGATVANRWFVEKRGLVLGLMGAGVSAGALIFIPAMMSLVLESGWRVAVALPLLLLGVVVLPLAFVFMRDQPADVGLEPYGKISLPSSSAGPLQPHQAQLSEALRTTDFWLLAASFFVCGFTSNGLIGTHLIPHAVEHGFAEYTAAGAMALMGAMNVVGTMFSGYLTDRFNPRRLLAMYYGLRALSLVLLPLVSDVTGLMLFAILFGLDYIATVPPTAALTSDRFGKRAFGSIFGWINFSHQVGAAAAAFGGGVVRVWFGDYQVAILAAGALGFIAAALSLRIATSLRPATTPA